MRGKPLNSLLAAAFLASAVGSTQAQLSYTGTTLGPLPFNALPAVAEWSTGNIAGSAGDITDPAALDADVNANVNAANIITVLGQSGTFPPSENAIARWNNNATSGFFLQTRPTGVRYNILMATIQNDSGSDVTSVTLSYDWDQKNPIPVNESVAGHRVYYSVGGAPGSWTVVPSLSTFDNNSTAQALSADLNVSSPAWTAGSRLYIIWVDDNGPGSTTNPQEGANTIDNVQIIPANQPPLILTQPASVTVNERQVATLSVTASGSGLGYQWYRGNPGTPTLIPGANAASLRVTNIMGGARYAWSNPSDSGTYFVRVSGSAGGPLDSDVITVTVNPDTTAPAFSHAQCGPGSAMPEQMTLIVSEPLNNAGGEVTDACNWEITTLDNSSTLNIAGIAYNDNGASTTITFDLDPMLPRDPTKGYKITLTAAVLDTATTANSLIGPVSTPVLCFTNQLLGLTANWQYNDDDVEPIDQLPTTWKDVAYVDAAAPWATGAGPFDAKRGAAGMAGANCRDTTFYGLGAVGTCINLESPVTLTNLITSYYRTHFNFAGSTAGAVLLLEGKFDDGAVVYLNGTEIWRVGMAASAVTHTTLATRTVNDGDAQDTLVLPAPASLVSGDNVIAYSLHQINLTSSDLTGGLSVSRLVADPPAAQPSLTITAGAGTVTITSTVAGTLISSSDIAAPRASWTNEGAIGAGAPGVTLPATAARRFFAVRVP